MSDFIDGLLDARGRYWKLYTEKKFFQPKDVKAHCPKCGAEINPFLWGCGWDFDHTVHPCENCGYEGPLKTITEYNNGFDGEVVQTVYEK